MKSVSLTAPALLILYCGGYALLIDKNSVSYGPSTGTYYAASCRISPWVRVSGPLSIYSRKHSVLNIIYAPLGANEEMK